MLAFPWLRAKKLPAFFMCGSSKVFEPAFPTKDLNLRSQDAGPDRGACHKFHKTGLEAKMMHIRPCPILLVGLKRETDPKLSKVNK